MSDTPTFWARRKAAVEAESRAEAQANSRADVEQNAEGKTDAELLAQYDLPEPETLGIGDDFSAFMSKAIPDRLRRRALRVLWRTNPVLANVDNLVDYGEDFTDSAMAVENIQTAYQVGKGMLAHLEKMAANTAAAEDQDEPLVEPDAEEAAPEPEQDAVAQTEAPQQATHAFADEEPALPPAPRRMTFTFETGSA